MPDVTWPAAILGTDLPFLANGSVSSYDYLPGNRPTALEVIVDQDGTMEGFVVNDDGVARSMGTPTAITANLASGSLHVMFVDFPTRRLRVIYTNTSGVAGVARFRARAQ